MESCPTQAVLPLVGLAADKVIRDRYKWLTTNVLRLYPIWCPGMVSQGNKPFMVKRNGTEKKDSVCDYGHSMAARVKMEPWRRY
ncbi:MAG: hypothetical protein ACQESR_29050 [Planctomycetota bacterium]